MALLLLLCVESNRFVTLRSGSISANKIVWPIQHIRRTEILYLQIIINISIDWNCIGIVKLNFKLVDNCTRIVLMSKIVKSGRDSKLVLK